MSLGRWLVLVMGRLGEEREGEEGKRPAVEVPLWKNGQCHHCHAPPPVPGGVPGLGRGAGEVGGRRLQLPVPAVATVCLRRRKKAPLAHFSVTPPLSGGEGLRYVGGAKV